MKSKEILKEEEFLVGAGEAAALEPPMFSTMETFEVNGQKPKKKNWRNCCMCTVVTYLILLSVGMGMLVVQVMNLQMQLLDNLYDNEILRTENSSSNSLPWMSARTGSNKLHILQTQLTQVCSRQEHLQQQVDNFTRSPELFRVKGERGAPGPQGPPGQKGEAGLQGPKGAPGSQGATGSKGNMGERGLMGFTGPPPPSPGTKGVPGSPGMKGDQGHPGAKGLPGVIGQMGPPGIPGENGKPGSTGLTGPPGRPGSPGPEGMKGSKGDTGLQGQKGTKGDTGAPGLVGMKGEKGAPGLVGLKGATGAIGQKGEPGLKGSAGQKGQKGEMGEKGRSVVSARIVGSPNRGRAEVLYNGVWGTICDDDWDNLDALVFCRMLDFTEGSTISNVVAGSGQIWLDNVNCQGTEMSLWDCRKNNWGSHNCNHGEDAGVHCS